MTLQLAPSLQTQTLQSLNVVARAQETQKVYKQAAARQVLQDIPTYVTHPRSVQGEVSIALNVMAVNQAGKSQQFDVLVPLAIAYLPVMAAQSTLNLVKGRGWDVVSAERTGNAF